MTRFSFASLLLAVAGAAQADQPIAEVQAAANPTTEPAAPQPPAAPLQAKWTTSVKGKELTVQLTVLNTGTEATDIVVSRGKLPGAYVQASIAGSTLERIYTKDEMKAEYSRMGPMPVYGPLGAGKEILAGTYKFVLPDDYAGQPIHLDGDINQHDGSTHVETDVTSGKAGV